MPPEDAEGKGKSLEEAFDNAGKNGSGKWGKGQRHKAKARIQVELSENPGSIHEYTVFLSKI
jgi:hypothetical protein